MVIEYVHTKTKNNIQLFVYASNQAYCYQQPSSYWHMIILYQPIADRQVNPIDYYMPARVSNSNSYSVLVHLHSINLVYIEMCLCTYYAYVT